MPMNNETIRPDYVENYLTLINWMMKNHRDTSHLLVHDDTVNRNDTVLRSHRVNKTRDTADGFNDFMVSYVC